MNGLIKAWDRLATPSEREEKIESLYGYTRQLLTNPLCDAAIHAVAGALLDQKQLTGEQAQTLICRAIREAKTTAKESGKPPLKIACPQCAEYDEEW